MSSPSLKRPRFSRSPLHLDDSTNAEARSENSESSDQEAPGMSEASSPDTDAEIADVKWSKSKKTLKRKRRATEPSQFGATLQSLLDTEAPSALPLSLKPSVNRQRTNAKLELKAKKVLQVEKKEKEDKGHVTDVIGGWGGESERALRKVAQRGVVKLFNAIQQSQTAAVKAAETDKASRGTGKPSLPAPSFDKQVRNKGKGKSKDNILGRGKEVALGQEDFFNMIRAGGIVSKT